MKATITALIWIWLALTPSESLSDTCETRPYLGFDSRVKAEAIAAVAGDSNSPPVGFAVVNGAAVVAYPHRLVATRGANSAVIPSLAAITGLTADHEGQIRIQAGDAVKRLSSVALEADSSLKPNGAALLGTGTSIFLQETSSAGVVHFAAVRPDGKRLSLFSLRGDFKAGSWNGVGLAAVIGDSLFTWRQGAASAEVLANDSALGSARDVCLVGSDAAVVALRNIVVLYSQGHRTILAGMQARCAWTDSTLYLLDTERRFVWKIANIAAAEDAKATAGYIAQLTATAARAKVPGESDAFREAARFIGCAEAERRLGIAPPPARGRVPSRGQ